MLSVLYLSTHSGALPKLLPRNELGRANFGVINGNELERIEITNGGVVVFTVIECEIVIARRGENAVFFHEGITSDEKFTDDKITDAFCQHLKKGLAVIVGARLRGVGRRCGRADGVFRQERSPFQVLKYALVGL